MERVQLTPEEIQSWWPRIRALWEAIPAQERPRFVPTLNSFAVFLDRVEAATRPEK